MADFVPTASPIARFRYLVVSAVVALVLQGWRRSEAVRHVAGCAHLDGARLKRVSERTVWRWLAAFEASGLAGLEPAARRRTASSVVLPEDFVAYLVVEKARDPAASVPELIRRAKLAGALHPNAEVHRSTVWRALRRLELSTRRRRSPPARRSTMHCRASRVWNP